MMRYFVNICRRRCSAYRAELKRAAALVVMILITVGSVATVMAATHTAHIVFDGTKRDVEISDSATDAILQKAGIALRPGDEVERTEDPEGTGDVFLTVRTGRVVSINEDGTIRKVTVHFGDTVRDALEAANVSADGDDALSPSADTAVLDGMTVRVNKRCSVTVRADGKTFSAVVHQGTVYGALKEAGVSVAPTDKLNASSGDTVTEGMNIAVTRVVERRTTETQPVAFKTVRVSDSSLASGQTKVKTEGQNGAKTVVKQETLTDGKVTDSQVIRETVTQEPVDRVLLVGTKKSRSAVSAGTASTSGGTLVDHSGNTVRYKRYLTGRCTAYTGGGTTATGKAAAFGRVAVNPSVIPYGTRLYICSADGRTVYGYAVAADTGGSAMANKILADLYYDTLSQCVNFGVRNMRIYIL